MSERRDFSHFLITRFNVPFPSANRPSKCLDGEWLDERMELFERYCVPSVIAQRDADFTWVILIHDRTPVSVRAHLRDVTPAIQIAAPGGYVLRAVQRLISQRGTHAPFLVTSRLDSDDALHVTYMERVHASFAGQALECIDIPWGYTYDPRTELVQLRFKRQNPFIALIEKCDGEPRTVFATASPNIHEVAPVRALDDSPGWLQVIHGGNIRNTMKGRPFRGDMVELLRTGFAIQAKPD